MAIQGSGGSVQAEDSCDWCHRAATASSLAESERLGLTAEGWYACDTCLAAKVYLREPPQGWDDFCVWPFFADQSQRG